MKKKKSSRNASVARRRARAHGERTRTVRGKPNVHPGRAVGENAKLPPVAKLFNLLEQEKIPFLIVGMSAAVLQGVPYTTLDTDIWINLPPRNYIRVLNLCESLDVQIAANTVVILPDGTVVNFIYEISGLRSFTTEYRNATELTWLGKKVHLLPVDRLLVSKRAAGRPKDVAHLPILEKFLSCQRVTSAKRPVSRKK